MKRRFFTLVLSLVLALAGLLPTAAGAASNKGGPYLALGDSVAFGHRGGATYEERLEATNFKSYADWLAREQHLALANAACPGETTGSFIDRAAPDNGCPAYRSLFPLHVAYPSAATSQLAYALAYLAAHPDTELVTISLGANDLLMLQNQCTSEGADFDACVATGLARVGNNLAFIYQAILATGYRGPLVALQYYSPYSDAPRVAAVQGLNGVIGQVTAHYAQTFALPWAVADGFAAFEAAAEKAGGDYYAASLLLPGDIHPTQKGHRALAAAHGR
jgi:lysophospholipase L1-like esterase